MHKTGGLVPGQCLVKIIKIFVSVAWKIHAEAGIRIDWNGQELGSGGLVHYASVQRIVKAVLFRGGYPRLHKNVFQVIEPMLVAPEERLDQGRIDGLYAGLYELLPLVLL